MFGLCHKWCAKTLLLSFWFPRRASSSNLLETSKSKLLLVRQTHCFSAKQHLLKLWLWQPAKIRKPKTEGANTILRFSRKFLAIYITSISTWTLFLSCTETHKFHRKSCIHCLYIILSPVRRLSRWIPSLNLKKSIPKMLSHMAESYLSMAVFETADSELFKKQRKFTMHKERTI